MTPDASAFERAVQRLHEGLARHLSDPGDEQLRDGLIQRFEFTYELSHRMLRRYLMETAASPDEIEQSSFADMIRTGNTHGLLRGDSSTWRKYREMRTRSTHTYNADTAMGVAAGIPAFLDEAEHLLNELRRRAAP